MTEELLAEVVGKMNEACKGRMRFGYNVNGAGEWRVYWLPVDAGMFCTNDRYSRSLTLPQLIYWCEAWLKGFAEAKAAYDNAEV